MCCSVRCSDVCVFYLDHRRQHHSHRWRAVRVAVSVAVRVAVCVAVIRMYYMRMIVGSITRIAGEQ